MEINIPVDLLKSAVEKIAIERVCPDSATIFEINNLVANIVALGHSLPMDNLVAYRDGVLLGLMIGRFLEIPAIQIKLERRENV